MTTRHVYSTRDLAHARSALEALAGAGFDSDHVSLVARSDIELEHVPDTFKEADTDAIPAAVRGMGLGGATGLLALLARRGYRPVQVMETDE